MAMYTDGWRSLELSGLGVSSQLCGGAGRRRCPEKVSQMLIGSGARSRRSVVPPAHRRTYEPPAKGTGRVVGADGIPLLLRPTLDAIAQDRSASPECLLLWKRAQGEALGGADGGGGERRGKRCTTVKSAALRRRRSRIDDAAIHADRVRSEQRRQRENEEFDRTVQQQRQQRDKARERLFEARCDVARSNQLRALAVSWRGGVGKRVVYPPPDARSTPSSPQYNAGSSHADWGAFAATLGSEEMMPVHAGGHQLDGGGVCRELLGGAPVSPALGGKSGKRVPPQKKTGQEFLPLGVPARSWSTTLSPQHRRGTFDSPMRASAPTGKITCEPAPDPVPSTRHVVPSTDLRPKRDDRLRPEEWPMNAANRAASAPPRSLRHRA